MWRRKVGERGRAYIEEYIGRSANAWRAVEGVMADRRISKKLKVNSCALVLHRHASTGLKTWHQGQREQEEEKD